MNENTQKRNTIFILLAGVVGLSYGALDFDSVISDLMYLRFDIPIQV